MSEPTATTIEAPKATIYVERKVQVRDYESLVVGMHFPVDLPTAPSINDTEAYAAYLKEVDANLKAGFTTVKCHVFEQLGLQFTDANGVITEKVTAKFEGAAEVQPSARPQRATAPAAAGVPAECPACGGTAFWDNRESKLSGKFSAKSPDFKCKNKGCDKAIWLTKKGS